MAKSSQQQLKRIYQRSLKLDLLRTFIGIAPQKLTKTGIVVKIANEFRRSTARFTFTLDDNGFEEFNRGYMVTKTTAYDMPQKCVLNFLSN